MLKDVRAQIIAARTYCRPLENNTIETWSQVVDRVLSHQKWLWERAQNNSLSPLQLAELGELRDLMLSTKVLPSGRILWMSDTSISKERMLSSFNCSALCIETVNDVVDAFWLLLNGCGVGFKPIPGTLNGFAKHINNIEVIRSERSEKGGRETNLETISDGKWTISIGDSGEAWAKAIGKLLAGKFSVSTLVFDLSNIRPAGSRLSRYGWISSGDNVLSDALVSIANILNRRAGQLLTTIDILDIVNWLGVIQTGRRGAEIALVDYGSRDWKNFATAKKDFWNTGNPQRAQSNNSLVFWDKPSQKQLNEIFQTINENGGSEPGFSNGQAIRNRAPYANAGLSNPCHEILLGNKSFCNLILVDISKFYNNPNALQRAVYLAGRANYRQTCVDLNDGLLQAAWQQNQEFLRLCGVSLTGIVMRPDFTPYDFRALKYAAIKGTHSMAEELGTPLPKNVTTIQPAGTTGKVMACTEGIHKPLGRYIFNNIVFSEHDPLVDILEKANYKIFRHPYEKSSVVITFPIEWNNVPFETIDGTEVNLESAISQLNRYRLLMNNYVDHNVSITVSYSLEEIPSIIEWLDHYWDDYVGVSFLYRTDPTKTAEDLGYPYLPQAVVSSADYKKYVSILKTPDLGTIYATDEMLDTGECAGGSCPIR